MWKRSFAAALFLGLAFTAPAPLHAHAAQQPDASIASTFAWPLGAFASRFVVVAGDAQHDLGSWAKVDGLGVRFDVIDYRAGGGTLTLHRAAGGQSLLVKEWLQQMAESLQPTTVTIVQYDLQGTPLARWVFSGVYPTKWSIGFESSESQVSIETLVLAYERLDVVTR